MRAFTAIVLVDDPVCLEPLGGSTALERVLTIVDRARGIRQVCIQTPADLQEKCRKVLDDTPWRHAVGIVPENRVIVVVSAHYPLLRSEYVEAALEMATNGQNCLLGTEQDAWINGTVARVFIPLQIAKAYVTDHTDRPFRLFAMEDSRCAFDVRNPALFSAAEAVLMYGD